MNRKPGLDRRTFSFGAAAMPAALAALGNAAQAQTIIPETATHVPPVGGAAAIKEITTRLAGEPFDRPIQFQRDSVAARVRPFPRNQVHLGNGPFRDAHNWNTAYMKRLPLDRLLHTFRINAGISSSAQPLKGWEIPDGELRGHFIGHYLSGCAFAYATMGDTELKQRGDQMVAVLADCQARLNQGGYLSAYPVEFYDRLDKGVKVWAPYYTMHKLMAGLLDMHTEAGNAQALVVLTNMAGWVDNWTASKSETHMQEILNIEFGGMNELLYNLADVTGEDRWARVGDRFTKKVVFNPLAQSRDELQGRHMNTHVPQIIGAARRYELSRDHRFHDVANFFWNTVVANRTYVTGGSSNRENWLSTPNRLSDEWTAANAHQECCCSYNMMKLTRLLFGWQPDARYMDYYERVLFNHRLGTIQPETGLTMYLMPVSSGAWRVVGGEDDTFWCCNGSALEEFNKLSDTIYYHDDRNIWVNLFLDSDLDWKERGIRVKQETRFPQEPRTRLVVDAAPAESWAMNLRIPGWTDDGVRVLVNGKPLDAGALPGSYLTIKRHWKKGDTVVLEMPMPLRKETMPDDPGIQAVLVGPLVLAGQFPKGQLPPQRREAHGPDLAAAPYPVPDLAVRTKPPETWLKPDGAPLTWRTTGIGQDIVFKPFHESWERYAVYWRTV